ncbi:hypothetical protein [Pseudomonas sp. KNUC1026]|uniref:hypothetical protein n=1 Tax=Pseudomonas sp. KNUC1026 TaxID=2893890 RepID=UPI001F2CF79E|nr:hypothetical protein [Pseudomonas sp. KNUC1026]UFH50061.1 hypothetical protein LN139_01430 [Pseudomonas sp. KNUC1026]
MVIEASTLAELTKVLAASCGETRVAHLKFIRAPYRDEHRWICVVEGRAEAIPLRKAV